MSLKDKLRVMVVDDLSASRALVYNCFDMMGVRNVMAAKNGIDALKAIQKSPVHIVVSDYNMRIWTAFSCFTHCARTQRPPK